ncbi:MAG TPA: helical backbone metal receptor [Candidatus Binataceae bacterium]|nr:helical backbone metal receptor [Candidatus Binataceae bacterium]
MSVTDDLGFRVELKSPPRRIISLVPSWTETLFAMGLGDLVVGITKFCVEPAAGVASIAKIGGTKNPDLRAIAELKPDFVIANAEENRREDVEKIRDQGAAVFTTYPKTIPGAVDSILKLGKALGKESEADIMAREIVRNVSGIEASVGVWSKLPFRIFCPIWKNPWMAFNADTYAHDVLRMLGFNNVFAAAGERYPATTLAEAIKRKPDIILLPDEPYEFKERDIEELRQILPPPLGRRVIIISGRDLHWYGVHMVQGLPALAAKLAKMRAALQIPLT